jgi:hypothetical protein
MLGWCTVCQTLVTIVPRGYDATLGGRARAYYPVEHSRPAKGGPQSTENDETPERCPGVKKRL